MNPNAPVHRTARANSGFLSRHIIVQHDDRERFLIEKIEARTEVRSHACELLESVITIPFSFGDPILLLIFQLGRQKDDLRDFPTNEPTDRLPYICFV